MNLSLDEKLTLLSGVGFWHTNSLHDKIKHLELSDGPHGLRKQLDGEKEAEPAVCYPTASALACTFDPGIIGRIGDELGKECKEKCVSVLLGPGTNMKRSPLCGRNFEYFSEDPYLAGKMASSFINGVQQNGVGTSLKHFAANSQETHRMRSDSVIDERTLREIYLKAFEMTVKNAQPTTIMASYNLINGKYSCENKWMLTDVLRNEWGYKGIVISDWCACSNLTKSVQAGMDLEMPDSLGIHKECIRKDLENGLITEEEIDAAVNRILEMVEKIGQTESEEATCIRYTMDEFAALDSTKRRHKLAYEAAVNAGVLLKNEDILPFNTTDKICIVGDLAVKTRFQGGGSSHINAVSYPNILECMQDKFTNITFARGYDSFRMEMDERMENEAISLAQDADIILYCGGLTDLAEGEGYDRETLKMPPNQIHLIGKLQELGKKLVFLSFGGAPYEMEGLVNFDAVLHMYLGGEAVAEAAVAILSGLENPSGHLAESWPLHIEDTPAYHNFASREKHVPYTEGIFIGYRHYNSKKIPVQFPFGYGLSYTDFEFDHLMVRKNENGFVASVDVTNTGNRSGKALVQLYVRNCKGDFERADLELRGFEKVTLNPGEKKEVNIEIPMSAFAVYDINAKDWVIPEGEYGICIGKSVEEIELSENVFVEGVKDLSLPKCEPKIPEEDGEAFTITSSFLELAEYSETARQIMDEVTRGIQETYPDKSLEDPFIRMVLETFKDGTADSAAMLNRNLVTYDRILKAIEEANENYKK
ncbi:MAG: glycoside hydrolase family 3 C-terminal domain-containing protein [Lachnospiraceae bacterium]|nr:glycoside hydrolase family 3 C-terminal domain-containing protein [Lachnospiraceae bacterium]